jgi:hypothetical protein
LSVSGNVVLAGVPNESAPDFKSGAADIFEMNDLALDAEPNSVAAGDALTITTCGGLPTGAVLLAAIAINGAPTFLPLAVNAFDGGGRWALGATVPSGLSGLVVQLKSFGIESPGVAGSSNSETIVFE